MTANSEIGAPVFSSASYCSPPGVPRGEHGRSGGNLRLDLAFVQIFGDWTLQLASDVVRSGVSASCDGERGPGRKPPPPGSGAAAGSWRSSPLQGVGAPGAGELYRRADYAGSPPARRSSATRTARRVNQRLPRIISFRYGDGAGSRRRDRG